MMNFLFELVVHLMLTLGIVKIVFFRGQSGDPAKEDSSRWKSAAEGMLLMETRLEQLTQRDLKQQERVWVLEDQNRDLQQRLTRMTLDLRGPPEPRKPSPDTDDDRDSSIPVNTN